MNAFNDFPAYVIFNILFLNLKHSMCYTYVETTAQVHESLRQVTTKNKS